jgi:hypothetical protein
MMPKPVVVVARKLQAIFIFMAAIMKIAFASQIQVLRVRPISLTAITITTTVNAAAD